MSTPTRVCVCSLHARAERSLLLTDQLWCIHTHAALGLDGIGCTGNSMHFNEGVHTFNKKHLKNVRSIRHNEPPHAHSPDVASGIVARRLRIDVHDNDDNDNA